MACISIANIVKTSLGPVGLDKMLVDDIGDTTVISMEMVFSQPLDGQGIDFLFQLGHQRRGHDSEFVGG